MYIYIYIYIYTHIHIMYIYIYICIYTPSFSAPWLRSTKFEGHNFWAETRGPFFFQPRRLEPKLECMFYSFICIHTHVRIYIYINVYICIYIYTYREKERTWDKQIIMKLFRALKSTTVPFRPYSACTCRLAEYCWTKHRWNDKSSWWFQSSEKDHRTLSTIFAFIWTGLFQGPPIYIYIYIYIIYLFIYLYIYLSICLHIYIYIICSYMYRERAIYIYIYIHVYTHIMYRERYA